MTITEIALLSLSSHVISINTDLSAKLANAKKIMQEFTGRRFYYLQQCEDPSLIYIIGEWDSLDQHMNEFIPSESNQAVLESLKDDLSVLWLLHIDAPHASLPLPRIDTATVEAAPILSIRRFFIKDGAKESFHDSYEASKHHLQDKSTEGFIGGGWRVDQEDGKDEWISLCPFTNVQQHPDLANTDGSEGYEQMRVHTDGAEMRLARFLDI
jgi:heme-degrading monooxygenase HmoA